MTDNEPLSSIMHFAGVAFAVAGLVLLVVAAVRHGTAWHVVGFSIFGAAMILLYAASGVYHLFPESHRHKRILKRIDHTMIFVLIAGTCTPIFLTVLRGPWGWSLFGVVWGLAAAGMALKWTSLKVPGWISTLLYIAIGWLPVIAFVPLARVLPRQGVAWLFIGGILYTVGAIFYGLDHLVPRTRWFGMHEVFHLFVLAGTTSHFWLMFRYVVHV